LLTHPHPTTALSPMMTSSGSGLTSSSSRRVPSLVSAS
jgi:hypothetical protein